MGGSGVRRGNGGDFHLLGGLRSVAVTDALQFGVISAAGLVIWFTVWGEVVAGKGWSVV